MPVPADVRRLTTPPAIAMLVAAVLAVMASLLSIGLTLLQPDLGIRGLDSSLGGADIDPAVLATLSWVSMLAMLALGLASAFGAIALLRSGSWALGLTAAILLCIPCAWPLCCPFPAGIGIWAIVVLLREDVRAGLGGTASAPPAFTVPPPPADAGPARPERERDDPGGGWGS